MHYYYYFLDHRLSHLFLHPLLRPYLRVFFTRPFAQPFFPFIFISTLSLGKRFFQRSYAMAPFIHHHQPRSTRESPLKTDNNETTITANSSNSSRPTICSIPIEAHPLVDCSWFGSEDYENEKTGAHHRTSNASRRHPKQDYAKMHSTASTSPSSESSFSSINDYPPSPFTANMNGHLPHPKLEKVGPYMTIASLQAYTILTVVRCLADPTWIVLQTSDDKSGGQENFTEAGMIGKTERWLLGCAIAFTMLSCLGVTLRIMDKFIWLRRVPVICAYFQCKENK